MNELLRLAAHFLLSGVSVLLVSAFLPGMKVERFSNAVWFSVVVAIFSTVAWKVMALVTVPFAMLTLGAGYFVVQGLVFLLAKKVTPGVQISGCFTAMVASALVGVVNYALHGLLR